MFNLFTGGFTKQDMVVLLVRVFIMLLILPLHEYAHAWTAHKLGDDTALYQGRLTLNPLAHVDPIGGLLLVLTGFGWAKPVPIDPSRFTRKHSMRFGVALTAAAGPLSNIIAALLGTAALRIYETTDMYAGILNNVYVDGTIVFTTPLIVWLMLSTFISVNVGLAVFNLIPVPPLDGSKVLGYFTPANVDRWFQRNEQVVRIVFLALIVTGILDKPLEFLSGLVMSLLNFLTSWIPLVLH